LTETFPQIRGIIQNINRSPGNVILGSEDKLLYGSYYLQETLGKISFRIHYQSFFQINTGTTERLYRHLAAFLSPDQIVLDAYCGIGSIGLFIANSVKQVIGIEEIASAITDAEFNREQNGITNAIFHTGKVEDLLPELIQKHSFDTIILDPPRKGVESSALAAISQYKIPQILYVSCNPMTMARDIKLLSEKSYQIQSIQPFDMFPQTWHIETVVQLTKIMQD
jgi:23S rRNA (uracil1939-C5)-methyltransferase